MLHIIHQTVVGIWRCNLW